MSVVSKTNGANAGANEALQALPLRDSPPLPGAAGTC
jgi:hypothetical protein